MKEYKSKKTGRIQVITEEEHKEIVRKGVINLKKFIITDLKIRNIIPSIKTEIKKKKE